MKNFIMNSERFLIAIFLVSCYLLFSSSTDRETESGKPNTTDTIAIISTYLDIVKPTWPIVGSKLVSISIKAVSPKLTLMMEANMPRIRRNVALLLKNNFKCVAIYGQGLQQRQGFDEIKKKFNFDPDSLKKDDGFPSIVFAKNDLNPFKFGKKEDGPSAAENYLNLGKGAEVLPAAITYFKVENKYKETVAKICESLNVNYIAVSYTCFKITPFENNAYSKNNGDGLSIVTYVYLFNKSGVCVSFGHDESVSKVFQARQIEDYQRELNKNFLVLKPVIENMAGK